MLNPVTGDNDIIYWDGEISQNTLKNNGKWCRNFFRRRRVSLKIWILCQVCDAVCHHR